MPSSAKSLFTDRDPLIADAPAVWDSLIDAVGPASILVVIQSRMSAGLRKRLSPEDIWQEALLHAWRDRARHEWRGVKSFRSWLLTIIDNRIRDAADRETAAKRGGGQTPINFSALEQSGSQFPGPIGSTTPSRVAIHQEQATAMRAALETLPIEVRDVVRLRLFEQRSIEEIARELDIGASAVRHRFRKGAAQYQRRLITELTTRSGPMPAEFAAPPRPESSAESERATD